MADLIPKWQNWILWEKNVQMKKTKIFNSWIFSKEKKNVCELQIQTLRILVRVVRGYMCTGQAVGWKECTAARRNEYKFHLSVTTGQWGHSIRLKHDLSYKYLCFC